MVTTQKSAIPPTSSKPSKAGGHHGRTVSTEMPHKLHPPPHSHHGSHHPHNNNHGHHQPSLHNHLGGRHSKVSGGSSMISVESSLTNSVADSIESDFIPASLALGTGQNVLLMCLDNNLANSNRVKRNIVESEQTKEDHSLVENLAAALQHQLGQSISSTDSSETVPAGKGARKNTGGIASTSTIATSKSSSTHQTGVGNKGNKIGPHRDSHAHNHGSRIQRSNSNASTSTASSFHTDPHPHPPPNNNMSKLDQIHNVNTNPNEILSPPASASSAIGVAVPPVAAIAPPTASTVSRSDTSSQQQKSDKSPSPPRLRLPNGKRMTRTDEKFFRLTKFMPGIKIDRRMRQTIIQSMREINCWSDSDEDDESSSKDKKNKKKIQKLGSHDLQEESTMTSGTPKVTFAPSNQVGSPRLTKLSISTGDSDSGGNSPSLSPTRDSSNSNSPTRSSILFTRSTSEDEGDARSPGSMTRTIDDLSQPTSVRNRVTLVKPKQIQDSQALMTLEERKRLEREAVRENLIQKAIHLLVELRKEQDETQHMNVVSLLKEQSSSKFVAVKRVVFGLVDRAMKRAKGIAHVQMEKRITKQLRYEQRVREMGRRLLRIYRRYRLRKLCYVVMKEARRLRMERYLEERAEHYAFRQRIAQRRIEEDAMFKTWKRSQKENSTFPMKEIPESERKPIVMAENGDIIVSTSMDRKLLSQDVSDTRPDLAPFSTMINSMIYKYIRPVPDRIEDLIDTNNGYKFNEKQTFVHVSTISPRPPSAGITSRTASQSMDAYDDFNYGSIGVPPLIPTGPGTADGNPTLPANPPGGSTKGKSVVFASRTANLRPGSGSGNNVTANMNAGISIKSGSYAGASNVQHNTIIPNNAVIIQPPEPTSSNPYFITNYNVETGQLTRSLAPHGSALAGGSSKLRGASDKPSGAYRDVTLISKYQVEIPMWEQMARLDYVPPVKSVQADKKNKSAAYRALEKLCGLTEDDIKMKKRTNFGAAAIQKRPSDHMPLYNTNLLSLFK